MTARFIYCSTLLIAAIALYLGCSSPVENVSKPGEDQTAVNQYFPLDPGLTTTYRIDNANGSSSTLSYTVGKPLDYKGRQTYRWIKKESTGAIDTSYFFEAANGLFFVEWLGASTERMLAYPPTVGNSWSLSDEVQDTITIGTGIDTSGTGGGGGGGVTLSSNFFVEGNSTLTVASIEGIQLVHGSYYSGTVKVRNDNSNGTSNYYWYAPGIGIVKYVLGATPTLPNGQINGELISYSR